MWIRTLIRSVREGAVKLFAATGRPGETLAEREYFQHYGFTSRPLPGAEGAALIRGNHVIMVATEDRRYRIAVESGEVALYTDEGDFVHFKRGREIRIEGGNKIALNTGGTVAVEAGGSVTVTAPTVTITGDVRIEGPLHVTGPISGGGGGTFTGRRDRHGRHPGRRGQLQPPHPRRGLSMDFLIAADGDTGAMSFDRAEDIRNNVFLSLVVKRGSWFQNPDFGSRLHLLHRAKNTERTAALARDYCLEALAWLKETGRATDIEVETERDRTLDLCRLRLLVRVARADGRVVHFNTFLEVV